ncbi:hypothetical protein QYF36_015251 [Acer negundo]|nr:hypothetical protein QYF36_015251 [Acer negundo]
MIAAASIWLGWCFNLCVKWSVNSGVPFITAAKIADKTSDSARPSLGCNSKHPPSMPARRKASVWSRAWPLDPMAFELGLPVNSPAMISNRMPEYPGNRVLILTSIAALVAE